MTKTAMDKWKDYQLTEYFKSMPHFPQFLTRQPTAFNNAMDVQELIATYIKFLLEIGESQSEVMRIVNQFIKDQYEFLTGQQIVDVLKETLQQLYNEGWLGDVFNEMWGDDFLEWFEKIKGILGSDVAGHLAMEILKLQEQLEGSLSSDLLQHTFNNIGERFKFMDDQFESYGLDVRWFGVKADGKTDDTKALQTAFNFCSAHNIPAIIPNKTIMIKAHVDREIPQQRKTFLKDEGGVMIPSNTHIHFNGGTLKAFTTLDYAYNVLRTSGNSNIKITGKGFIQGEAKTHTQTVGEFGFGVAIFGGENIYIEGLTAYECWGDGFLTDVRSENDLTPVKNLKMVDCHADNNGRQGLSLQGNVGFYAERCSFKGSYRTAPMSGVDCEPWLDTTKDSNAMYDIVFYKCDFSDNTGSGFLSDGKFNEVELIDCTFKNNKKFDIETYETNKIKISKCDFNNNKLTTVNTNLVDIFDCRFHDTTFVNEDMNDFKGGTIIIDNVNIVNTSNLTTFRNTNGRKDVFTFANITLTGGGRVGTAIADIINVENINIYNASSIIIAYGTALNVDNVNCFNVARQNSLIQISCDVVSLSNISNYGVTADMFLFSPENKLPKSLKIYNCNIEATKLINIPFTGVLANIKNNYGKIFNASNYIGLDKKSYLEDSVKGLVRFNSWQHFLDNKSNLDIGQLFYVLYEGEETPYRMYAYYGSANIFELTSKRV